MIRRTAAAFVVVVAAACSTTDGAGAPEPADSISSTTIVDATGAEAPDEPSPSSTVATTTALPAAPIEIEPPIDSVPSIQLEAFETASPSRPRLTWGPVEGAALYAVMVFDGDQIPYWSTLTDQTETFVGGPVLLLEDKPGPRMPTGGSWHVTAMDESGQLLAWSAQITFAP